MWQFLIGVLVGGTIGFFVAVFVMGANVYKQDRINKKESNPPRNE